MHRSTSKFAIAAVLAGVAVAGLLGAGAAIAAPAPLPSKAVRYNDIDLNSARDVATLYRRIETAAGEVCGDEYQPGSRFVYTAWKVCVTTAIDAGVRQVDRPQLTAYHAVKTSAPSLIRIATRG